jgi:cation diffusion facilitator family transporter
VVAFERNLVEHGHHHDRDGDGDHDGPHRLGAAMRRLWHHVEHLVRPHSHEAADKVDAALESSREGMRALWISLAVLGVTALGQGLVVLWSGSVALLGDTVHNAVDALTAVPLGIAFTLGRRAPTRRYTYGYGRAEDLAGVIVVAFIAASSIFAGYEAIRRLADPAPVDHLWAVAAAGVLGFVGNEVVARYRIRIGRRIGSAALVADGLHARTDGFTSLAVVLGAGGVAAGWPLADPLVGLLITLAIAAVLREAAREVYRRLMDAVDPALLAQAERALAEVPAVLAVGSLRLRWIGHQLHAEGDLVLPGDLTLAQAHQVTVEAERHLTEVMPRLTRTILHPDPLPQVGRGPSPGPCQELYSGPCGPQKRDIARRAAR